MQTTAFRTVANLLPENGVIFLTLLISRRYIPYTDLRNKLLMLRARAAPGFRLPGFAVAFRGASCSAGN